MSKQSIQKRLRMFREQFEVEAQRPVSQVQSPVVLVLSDICDLLHLSPKEKQSVLGRRGAHYMKMTNESRIGIAILKSTRPRNKK